MFIIMMQPLELQNKKAGGYQACLLSGVYRVSILFFSQTGYFNLMFFKMWLLLLLYLCVLLIACVRPDCASIKPRCAVGVVCVGGVCSGCCNSAPESLSRLVVPCPL